MSGLGNAQLPKPGDIIAGKYSLDRIIGQGGMGAVFAARHVKLGHAVAIKVMLADRQNEEAARRFMNEGRASANIQNEHVVRIFDIDEEHGYAYMVLELLQGEDLAQVLEQQGRLAPHVAVGYVLQALEGVRQAHTLGIVHRDLKPSNLFLARLQSGNVVVKVLDFGISKAGGSALDLAPHQQTSTAAMLGSPLYMSPEQLRSSKNVDARADIWAMGVILYELLTGTVPFDGETLGALFAAILESEAPRVSAKAREVPPGLDAIIARCLQRRPEDRFASAADLERELAPFATAQAAASYPLMMTAAMPPPTAGAVPPGARGSMGSSAQGVPMSMGSPAAMTGYAAGAQSFAQSSAQQSQQRPVAPGTVPLGAITPQPYHQTGNTWQSTGAGTRPAKSSAGLVAAMVIGGVVLAAAALIGVKAFGHRGAAAGSEASASASAAVTSAPTSNVAAGVGTPSPSVSVSSMGGTPGAPDPAAASAAVASAASAPSSAPATPAVVTTAASHTTTGTKHPPAVPVAKVDPKPAETAKVDPPPPAPPPPRAPPPIAAPTGGTLQNGR